MLPSPLPAKFYLPAAPDVARALLGARLVRRVDSTRMVGYITEAEGYQGETDLACHARAGRTRRTEVMYGPPGRAYVYFTYGMHWMLNCVTGPANEPAAVLIRAILPVEGLEEMTRRRPGVAKAILSDGPAKLCQALGITGSLNGIDLTDAESELLIEAGPPVPDEAVLVGPRVGMGRTPEPWFSMPWRFRINPQWFKYLPTGND